MLEIVLLVIAAVCFALATFGVAARVNLVALGLLAITLAWLIPAID